MFHDFPGYTDSTPARLSTHPRLQDDRSRICDCDQEGGDSMNINARILLAGCCLACAPAFAGLSFVGTPAGLGSNDSTNWAQLGGDTTVLTGPFSATSALAVGVTGNFSAADNTGLVADVCPAAPTCSWTTSGAGMNAGDSDIWAFDNNAAGGAGAGTGPIDLSFSKSLLGAGAWLEGDTSGTYTASIQAFDGAVSLAPASTVVSNATGDPVF